MPCQTTCCQTARQTLGQSLGQTLGQTLGQLNVRPAPPSAAAGRPPLAARVLGRVREAWQSYWEWRARKATVMILHSLDARTLRDIGISPGEIESLVRCGSDRRRRYDAAWLWRWGGG
jgi:uncharacterized protein YjiS (DUF1127 family)